MQQMEKLLREERAQLRGIEDLSLHVGLDASGGVLLRATVTTSLGEFTASVPSTLPIPANADRVAFQKAEWAVESLATDFLTVLKGKDPRQ